MIIITNACSGCRRGAVRFICVVRWMGEARELVGGVGERDSGVIISNTFLIIILMIIILIVIFLSIIIGRGVGRNARSKASGIRIRARSVTSPKPNALHGGERLRCRRTARAVMLAWRTRADRIGRGLGVSGGDAAQVGGAGAGSPAGRLLAQECADRHLRRAAK